MESAPAPAGRPPRRRPFGPRQVLPWLLSGIVLGAVGFSAERSLSAEPRGCASCHVMRRYAESFESGCDLDAAHARAGVTCTGCHQGYSFSARARTGAAYALGSAGSPERRRYDDAMCNACHVSMARVSEYTRALHRDPHRSHWTELGCADCHRGHGRQVDFCSGCHDNGGQRMTGDFPGATRLPESPLLRQDECREP